MIGSRFPPDDATPLATPKTVRLDGGEEATITWTPERSGTTFYLQVLAASKASESTYRIKADGSVIYGPAAIPPTDIDDLVPVWNPAHEFTTSLELRIQNVGTGTRTYHAQPVGYETNQEVE